MPETARKRSRSEASDDTRPKSNKRLRPSSPHTAIESLTGHSVPSSPTGAAIWSGQLDLAVVNEKLMPYARYADSNSEVDSLEEWRGQYATGDGSSDVDSLKEWRDQYATDDDSSPGIGCRAQRDTPSENEESSTPVTSYCSGQSDTAECASREWLLARSCREGALSQSMKVAGLVPRSGAHARMTRRHDRDLEGKVKARNRPTAPEASKQLPGDVDTKDQWPEDDFVVKTRSGRVSRPPKRWVPE